MRALLLALLALLASGCVALATDAPTPDGCAPPENVSCADGVCSALYHCPHSKYVYVDDFTWCDLSHPEGYLCYWSPTDG